MRIRGTLAAMLAATATMVPEAAMAQSGDVVVMRRTVAPPNVDRDAKGYDQNQFHWETGDWQTPSSCETTIEQTRTVSCVKRRSPQSEANCTAAKPADRQTITNPTPCSSSWIYTAWSDTPSCGSVTNTRTATCKRSDGTPTPGACDVATREPLSETKSDTRTCTYSWKPGEWSEYSPSTCSDAATRSRSEACTRSDNTPAADALCAGKPHNALSEGPISVTSSCSWSWSIPRSDTTTGWGPWSNTCGTATRTRTVVCRRSGTDVADDQCYAHGAGDKADVQQTSVQNTDCTGKLVNGTFEAQTGWTFSTGAAYNNVNNPNGDLKAIHSGSWSVMMNSSSYGRPSVSQTFPTTIGGKYSVSYWAWAYGPQGIEAFVNNTSYGQVQPNCGNGCWLQKSFVFNATGTSTTLMLKAYYNNYGYVGLDDVVVSQIP